MNDEQLFRYFTELEQLQYQIINLTLSHKIYDAIIDGIISCNQLKKLSNDKTITFRKNVLDKFTEKRKNNYTEIATLEKQLSSKQKKILKIDSRTMLRPGLFIIYLLLNLHFTRICHCSFPTFCQAAYPISLIP